MIVCPWGADGSWGMDRDNRPLQSEAFRQDQVVDTLGAGDCFNAGLIHGLCSGSTLSEAMDYANRLAGIKVGQEGFSGLGQARL